MIITDDDYENDDDHRESYDDSKNGHSQFGGISKEDKEFAEVISFGDGHLREGEYKEAAEDFERAVDMDPDNPVGHIALGHAQFAAGDYRAAASAIRRGFELFPDWEQNKVDLADLYSDQGEFDNLLIKLEGWVDKNSGDHDARFLLAYAYYFSGHEDDAHTEFRKLHGEHPNDALVESFP